MSRNIDADIKARLHEQYRTPANNSNPQYEIIVQRPKYSVTDTSMFQVDTIRQGTNLGDLGIDLKFESTSSNPTMIYEVHNDDGDIKTATRSLPTITGNDWVDGVTIAEGTFCKVCFNGSWVWDISKDKYVFYTTGDPLLFYTDASDNLQVQTWEDDSDIAQLATNVTGSLDCIRGWKSNTDPLQDQGIIAAYIKGDGKCYYRQYVWNGTILEWNVESELTITGVTDAFTKISLFRTIDYRIGFVITTDQDEVYWKITDREWSGLAIRPEALEASLVDLVVTLTPIIAEVGYETETLEVTIIDFTLARLFAGEVLMEAAQNIDNGSGDYGFKIEIEFNEDVYDLTGNYDKFTIEDDASSSYPPTAIEYVVGSTTKIILTCTDFNAAYDDITITYTGAVGGLTGAAGQDLSTQQFTFTPTDLNPPVVDPPVLVSIENILGDTL